MPHAVALLLMALGCAPAQFAGPGGPFLVWVCPPVIEAPLRITLRWADSTRLPVPALEML